MLHSQVFVPGKLHLGDLINIIQQCFYYSPNCTLTGNNKICKCCGNNVNLVLKDILSLFDTNIKFVPKSSAAQIMPVWMQNFETPPFTHVHYIKSKFKNKTSDFYTYQFDTRSDPIPRKKTFPKSEIEEFLNLNQSFNLIDIGDKSNKTLLEKFHLIKESIGYIGVDSGLTHLALTTDTPIFLIYPGEINSPVHYYPESQQIRYIPFIPRIETL